MPRYWMYILLLAIVTYLIRVLPLTVFHKEIKNQTVLSFVLCTLYYAGGDDISRNPACNDESVLGATCFCGRYRSGIFRKNAAHDRSSLLRGRVPFGVGSGEVTEYFFTEA